jgi:hypothetical protein
LISLANILVMFVNNDSKIAGKTMGTTQSLRQADRSSKDERA